MSVASLTKSAHLPQAKLPVPVRTQHGTYLIEQLFVPGKVRVNLIGGRTELRDATACMIDYPTPGLDWTPPFCDRQSVAYVRWVDDYGFLRSWFACREHLLAKQPEYVLDDAGGALSPSRR